MASKNVDNADMKQDGPPDDSGGKKPQGEKVSRSGKTLRKQPDVLCNCPQKCGYRITSEVKAGLFKEFALLGDHYRQNSYLQSYIEMRSVYKRLWCQEERVGGRLQRRVSCKYKIPLEVPLPLLPKTDSPRPPKLSTNSKGKMTFIVGAKTGVKTVEVCQKAFMNVYGITEKRIRLQREKLIARLKSDTADAVIPSYFPKEPELMNYQPSEKSFNYDIAIVDNFFQNQLWKPEYIGITSGTDKTPLIERKKNIKA